MKTKKLNKNVPDNILDILDKCPNFHISGNIHGMKEKYYGKNALLVKHGSYIYNVSEYPIIYTNYAD